MFYEVAGKSWAVLEAIYYRNLQPRGLNSISSHENFPKLIFESFCVYVIIEVAYLQIVFLFSLFKATIEIQILKLFSAEECDETR